MNVGECTWCKNELATYNRPFEFLKTGLAIISPGQRYFTNLLQSKLVISITGKHQYIETVKIITKKLFRCKTEIVQF